MSNELIKQENGSLVSAINQKGVGEILKPLIREIHLFDTYVAGVSHLDDKSVLEEIKVDDKVFLVREGDNKYDSYAIVIRTESQKKLGYVPRYDNIVFARLMDAGKSLASKIKEIDDSKSFKKITIGIYLVDF